MKSLLLFTLSIISMGAFAQVQINKALQLTGSGNDAKIEGIKTVTNPDDAASKAYVDTTIANNLGGSSNMAFSLTGDKDTVTAIYNSSSLEDILNLNCKYLSGTPSPVHFEVTAPGGFSWDITPGGGYPNISATAVFHVDNTVSVGLYSLTITAVGGTANQQKTVYVEVIPAKRVFLTSTTYNGNLGGLNGGDAKCQARADAQSLGGTWKAWLSDFSTSAASRLSHSTDPYVRLDGRIIAYSWADLTDGNSIKNAISVDELGNEYPAQTEYAWTNCNTDGSVESGLHSCSNWSTSNSSTKGSVAKNDVYPGYWNGGNVYLFCDQQYRLICFEQ